MKSLVLLAALAGVSVTGTARAYNANSSTAPAPSASAPHPIAAAVVKPTNLPRDFSRALINVEFTLDAGGRPQQIKLPSVRNPQLKRQVVEAFRQWRFAPGTAGAIDAGKRYVLPLEIRAES